jgi:4-oxalocrotonate tautomerase
MRNDMPYVNIRVAGKLSRKQKKKIARGVTRVIAKEANKPESSILIMIDEVQRENVASAGRLLDEK